MDSLDLQPHVVFEALARASGFLLYRHLRRRQSAYARASRTRKPHGPRWHATALCG